MNAPRSFRTLGLPARHTPKDATAYTREGVDAVIYWYTTTAGKLCAIAYHGKSTKSDGRLRNRLFRALKVWQSIRRRIGTAYA